MTTVPIALGPAAGLRHGGWRALPVVATVLLLCVPAAGEGDVTAAAHITVADLASGAMVAICGIALLLERRRPLTWPAAAVLAAPLVGSAVTTAASLDAETSVSGFGRYVQIFVLVPAAMTLLLRSRRDVRWAAGALVAVALLEGGVGVYQYVTGTGASYAGQDIRAVGTFGPVDVMGMAGLVAAGLIIALAVGLAPPAGMPRWARVGVIGCAVLLLVPLVFSFSRGSWISTAIACTVVLLLAGVRTAAKTLAVVVAAAVVLVGGAGVGTALIAERMTSITQVTDAPDQSVSDRYALWSAATGIWQDNPVAGVGIKGFPAHRDDHASLGLSSGSDAAGAGLSFRREPLLSPHNMYLLLLSEQGLVGATTLLGSWLALLVLGLRRLWRTRRAGRSADIGLAAVGLMTYQFADFMYGDLGGPSTLLTGLSFGLSAWWALSPTALSSPTDPSPARLQMER